MKPYKKTQIYFRTKFLNKIYINCKFNNNVKSKYFIMYKLSLSLQLSNMHEELYSKKSDLLLLIEEREQNFNEHQQEI